MGHVQSTDIAEVTMKVFTKVATDIVTKQKISSAQSQIISISNVEKNVIVDGNVQRMKLNLNMESLMKAISTSSAQAELSQELTQASKAVVKGLNVLQSSEASSELKAYTKSSIDISTNIMQTCAATAKQVQVINVDQVNGNVLVCNNLQEQVANIFSTCVQDAISNSDAVNKVQSILDQSATAISAGIDIWALVAMLAIAVVGGIASIVVPIVVGGVTLVDMILKLIFPILGIVGIVFIILYFTGKTVGMTTTGFSRGIANEGTCGGVVSTKSTKIDNPGTAADKCLDNEGCVAFDWMGWDVGDSGVATELKPPQTTFFSKVRSSPCDAVENLPDSSKLIYMPAWRTGRGIPDSIKEDTIGDVYINLDNGNYYQNLEGQGGWGQELENLIPKGVPKDAGFVAKAATPGVTDGDKNGDLYLNINNPKSVLLFKRNAKGEWIPSKDGPVNGPGYVVKVSEHLNTSGFKYDKYKSWKLYVGLCMVGVSLIGIFVTAFGPKSVKK